MNDVSRLAGSKLRFGYNQDIGEMVVEVLDENNNVAIQGPSFENHASNRLDCGFYRVALDEVKVVLVYVELLKDHFSTMGIPEEVDKPYPAVACFHNALDNIAFGKALVERGRADRVDALERHETFEHVIRVVLVTDVEAVRLPCGSNVPGNLHGHDRLTNALRSTDKD